MVSSKVYGFCPSSKSKIDSICKSGTDSCTGGLAVPTKLAKGMIDMLEREDFFSVDSYISNGWFDKEAYADNHRILDVCCNSGILLEMCYYKFMAEFMSLEAQSYFKSNEDIENYVIKELLFAFVPDYDLCSYLRKRFYYNGECHGNIYNYNIRTSLGRDKIYITTYKNSISIGGKQLKFDVVCGNPPYNKDTYLDFVLLGHELSSKYDIWITPAKFISTADDYSQKSVNTYKKFRSELLNKISEIHFYPDALDIFNISQVDGLAYYIIEKDPVNSCRVVNSSVHNKTYNSEQNRVLSSKCSLYNYGNDLAQRLLNYPRFKPSLVNKDGTFKVIMGTQFVTSGCGSETRKTCKVGAKSNIFNSDGKVVVLSTNIGLSERRGAFCCAFASDDKNDCISFNSWINTKFVRFLVLSNISKLTGIYTDDYFKFVPAPDNFDMIYEDNPIDGYTPDINGVYVHEDGKVHCSLYCRYNLTDKEIETIESVIQSKSLKGVLS